MTNAGRFIRGTVAVLIAGAILFFAFNVLLDFPIWLYGHQAAREWPVSRQRLFFYTFVSVAAAFSMVGFAMLAIFVYRRFQPKE